MIFIMIVAKVYDYIQRQHLYLRNVERIGDYYIEGGFCFFLLEGVEYCTSVERSNMRRIFELAPQAKQNLQLEENV